MKPLKNNVLVAQAANEEKTTSGIFLAGTTETGVKPAIILEVGPAVVDVQVGDKVYLHWGKGMAVSYRGEQAALISEDHIEAIL